MFGYIKPNVAELKVKDYELYKATYCGLCRAMGKCTGCVSKMTLSYDFVFFALVRMAITKAKGEVKKRRCILHPFKKRFMLEINPTLEYTAKASVILTRVKLKDNINDTRGFSRFLARIANMITVFFKKTDKELLPLVEKIQGCFDELLELERQECDSIDMVANTSGELIGSVAAFGLEGNNAKIAYEIGFHLGKWVYVIDACDDLKKDIKKGSYNVLKYSFGGTLTEESCELLKRAMMLELNKMSVAINLIDFSEHRDVEAVIKNIVFEGLSQEMDRILDKCCNIDSKSENEISEQSEESEKTEN